MKIQKTIERREFLQRAASGAVCVLAGLNIGTGVKCSGKKRERPPNIIFIISDEHNPGVLGCYGNRIIQTPNIDRLAESGITFENAYTNSPLCVPSRLSFTAGKYISRISAWSNSCWLPSPNYPSLARIMNAAGYESYLCGKMHFDPTRRYGFIEIDSSTTNQYNKNGKGKHRAADDTSINTKTRDSRFANFHPGNESRVMTRDKKVTARTIEFLSNRRRTDKPFFLVAGYLAPHFPLIVPHEYWEPYRGKIPMPHLPPGHIESQPLNYHHLRRGFGIVETDPKIVQMGRELYYGLTQWVDNEIGKVLSALEKSGVADNTVVIYTSDHGENIGEHALWWKNCMYDHAVSVPLIINWPKRWKGGQRRAGVCSLVDVTQTIAELGKADVPKDWNGHSICALMDNPYANWKDFAVSEYYGHNIASGYAMLRAGKYKYVYHTPPDENYSAQRELYDLETDPGEFTNLAPNPDQKKRIEQMHAFLIKELGEHPDETEQRCRIEYAKGYERKDSID